MCFKICPDPRKTSPHKIFENFILLLIFTSSVMLVIDNPLDDPKSNKMKILSVLDTIHTILFSIEALIRIIALGFI